MLAETASEVEFIWSSKLDWNYINRARPDVVLYEIVERFMTVVPKDNLSLRLNDSFQGLRAKWLQRRAEKRAARRAKLP